MSNSRVVHDLKNELGIVLGFAELLLTDTVETPHQNDVAEILKAAQRAIALLDRLDSRADATS